MRVVGWLPPGNLTMGTLRFQGPAKPGGTKVVRVKSYGARGGGYLGVL